MRIEYVHHIAKRIWQVNSKKFNALHTLNITSNPRGLLQVFYTAYGENGIYMHAYFFIHCSPEELMQQHFERAFMFMHAPRLLARQCVYNSKFRFHVFSLFFITIPEMKSEIISQHSWSSLKTPIANTD